MTRILRGAIVLVVFVGVFTCPVLRAGSANEQTGSKSQVIERTIESTSFSQAKLETSPSRKLTVYLPPSYASSTKRYPVIYFLPSDFDGAYRDAFDKHNLQETFDRAMTSGRSGEFIFVTVNMSTPIGNSWYVNSPATGNWEDFMFQELVPYVDANFRTLATRDSRGILGAFMGGNGAIRYGMKHPDVFGAVYAMHPVGTGSGLKVMDSLPNWELLASAKSIDDVKKDGYSWIFTSIFEAFLPDANNPPLYFQPSAHKEGDKLVIDTALMAKLRDNFFIESLVPRYAENLKTLRGFKFDWDRGDSNQDHVYSNQALTHKLNEFGVPHEAEEYNGNFGEGAWGDGGRVNLEVIPFFARTLVFAN